MLAEDILPIGLDLRCHLLFEPFWNVMFVISNVILLAIMDSVKFIVCGYSSASENLNSYFAKATVDQLPEKNNSNS